MYSCTLASTQIILHPRNINLYYCIFSWNLSQRLQPLGKLFISYLHPLCAWLCLSLWMCVLQKLNSVTSLSHSLCTPLNTPCCWLLWVLLMAIPPFAHRLYWGDHWAGIALKLKETHFPTRPHWLSVQSTGLERQIRSGVLASGEGIIQRPPIRPKHHPSSG